MNATDVTWKVREHHPESCWCEDHWAPLYFPGGMKWTTDEESARIMLAQQRRDGHTVRLERLTREIVDAP